MTDWDQVSIIKHKFQVSRTGFKDNRKLVFQVISSSRGPDLLGGAVDGAIVDTIDDIVRVLTVHSAADRLCGAKNFLHGAGELLGHGPGPHDPGSGDDILHGDVTRVLDVLHLLPVPRWLLERLDDQSSGRWDHGDGGLTVLDTQLAGHLKSLPLLSGLGDVISNLLGRQSQGTDLGSQGAGSSDLSSYSPQVDKLDLCGVELGSHVKCLRDLELVDEVLDHYHEVAALVEVNQAIKA